jgi:imidazoleglycerol-phosphate dehydratase
MSGTSKKTPPIDADRFVELIRKTGETEIKVSLNLDTTSPAEIDTPLQYLNHMLHLLARHSHFTLKVTAHGDLPHHVVEDIAMVIGQALDKALGEKKGIERYGSVEIPMDDALALCAVDLSGRPYFVADLKLEGERVEDMATEDIIHFFETLAIHARMNLHLMVHYGGNNHHKVEACFKALAYVLRRAVKRTGDVIPSTKGIL